MTNEELRCGLINYLGNEEFTGVRTININSVEKSDARRNGVVDEVDHLNLRLRTLPEKGCDQAKAP